MGNMETAREKWSQAEDAAREARLDWEYAQEELANILLSVQDFRNNVKDAADKYAAADADAAKTYAEYSRSVHGK